MNLDQKAARFSLLLVALTGGACTQILGGFDFTGSGGGGSNPSTSGTSSGSTSTGSASSSSASSGSTSSGGTDAGGTDGGGGSTGTCTAESSVNTLLEPADFGAGTVGDNGFLVIGDPGVQRPAVHIVVSTNMQGQILVASVSSMGLNQFGTAKATVQNFSATAGYATPGATLHVQGSGSGSNSGLGELAFTLDSNEESVTSAAPTFTSWPTPPACMNGFVSTWAIADPSASPAHYAAACVQNNSDGGMPASLWLGTSAAAPPSPVAMGMQNDDLMNPRHYLIVGGTHIIELSGNNGDSQFVTTNDPRVIGAPTPFVLVNGQASLVSGMVPLPLMAGVTLFSASVVYPALTSGSLWSGSVQLASLGNLAKTPVPGLTQVLSASNMTQLEKFASLGSPAIAPDGTIYLIGPTLLGDQILASWTQSDGTPIALEQSVYQLASTATTSIIQAGVAPLGNGALAAWIEKDTSTSTPAFTLKARLYSCSM